MFQHVPVGFQPRVELENTCDGSVDGQRLHLKGKMTDLFHLWANPKSFWVNQN